jgi:hypothetical protein
MIHGFGRIRDLMRLRIAYEEFVQQEMHIGQPHKQIALQEPS